MGTERLQPLHNFNMPCDLRWGNQRHLRCMNINNAAAAANNSNHHHHRTAGAGSSDQRRKDKKKEFKNGSEKLDDGIAAVREKVIFDLQTAADKMKESIFKDSAAVGGSGVGLEEGEVVKESERPWNLRTRRAACRTGNVRNSAGAGGGDGLRLMDVGKNGNNNNNNSPVRMAMMMNKDKSPIAPPVERAKFSLPLAKREIEDDFASMGLRLPRRPKKRPRAVQRQLDNLFPGVFMGEVTADMYKVQEPAP